MMKMKFNLGPGETGFIFSRSGMNYQAAYNGSQNRQGGGHGRIAMGPEV